MLKQYLQIKDKAKKSWTWIKDRVVKIAITLGIIGVASAAFLGADVPCGVPTGEVSATGTQIMTPCPRATPIDTRSETKKELDAAPDGNQRKQMKAEAIKASTRTGVFTQKYGRDTYDINVIEVNVIDYRGTPASEIYVQAWRNRERISFGKGTVDIERLVIVNPEIKFNNIEEEVRGLILNLVNTYKEPGDRIVEGKVGRTLTYETFTNTATTSWVVPYGVSSVIISLRGSDGGQLDPPNSYGHAGRGGFVTGTLAVSAGQTYWFNIGGIGGGDDPGYNGGGDAGGTGKANGWGGGGCTFFAATSTFIQDTLLLIAAGGGGIGNVHGGRGGGINGQNASTSGGSAGGGGGSQTAGGTADSDGSPGVGTALQGGKGGISGNEEGGGGGCGYYGGGGGGAISGASQAGGGGGSSFMSSTLTSTSTSGFTTATSSVSASGTVVLAYEIITSPYITLNPTSFSFNNDSTSGTLTVTNSGEENSTLVFSITSTESWLTFSNTTGSLVTDATTTIKFITNLWGYASGTYNATATVEDSDATNSPQTVSVEGVVSFTAAEGGGGGGVHWFMSLWRDSVLGFIKKKIFL